jgi:hypothetical protein
MKTTLILATLMTAATTFAQVMIPDGTKVRVRLEQNLTSETAELGQTVDFAVTQEVRVNDNVVVANGARATGSIVSVQGRRSFGRGGKLDFTIDRVQLVDGQWLSVRYTPQKNSGKGNGVTTGVVTAGLAVVFLPAAPLAGLIKGHEATIIKGRTYDVFSDDSVMLKTAAPATVPAVTRVLPQAPAMTTDVPVHGAPATPAATATLSVNANVAGADIEVDGMFVGSAPTTIQLAPGVHKLAVRDGDNAWERDIQITSGTININANLAKPAVRMARK